MGKGAVEGQVFQCFYWGPTETGEGDWQSERGKTLGSVQDAVRNLSVEIYHGTVDVE